MRARLPKKPKRKSQNKIEVTERRRSDEPSKSKRITSRTTSSDKIKALAVSMRAIKTSIRAIKTSIAEVNDTIEEMQSKELTATNLIAIVIDLLDSKLNELR